LIEHRRKRERLETHTRGAGREGSPKRDEPGVLGGGVSAEGDEVSAVAGTEVVRVRTRNALVTIFGPGPCPGHRGSLRETRENGEKKRRGGEKTMPRRR